MLIFNGKKYARNNAEAVSTLFTAGNTFNGFYKRTSRGILLSTIQGKPEAFIVDNEKQGRFIVSCSEKNGKTYYMHSTCSTTEKWLGLDTLSYREQENALEACFTIPA